MSAAETLHPLIEHLWLVSLVVVVLGLIRLAIVWRALRGASPEQVPAILRALPGIFRGDWTLGSLGRRSPAETTDERPSAKDPSPD
jgi:hypothetical protein